MGYEPDDATNLSKSNVGNLPTWTPDGKHIVFPVASKDPPEESGNADQNVFN